MRDSLLQTYSKTKKSLKQPNKVKNVINVSFIESPRVSINGPVDQTYRVKFINNKTGYTTYSCEIKNNMWCKSTISYYVEWRILVESGGQIVFDEVLNLKDKKVLVVIDSQSLGDILAYTGQIDRFQIKHECKLDVLVFNKELAQILDSSYSNINFVSDVRSTDGYYAVYKIGYPLDNWTDRNPIDPRTIPLQKVASSVLGLDFKEERPILTFLNSTKRDKKYVTIATQSTAQCKYWNNEKGWEEVIKYLNSKGYEVWCIDRFPSFGNASRKINYIPKGAIDKTGDLPLEMRMSQIYNSEFFIGLGSGLSWLAWALNKPTVLISGFSKAFAEFETPYRVINESVCNGCWNDTDLKFDKSDWMWCPRNKNFECSKKISAKMVIDKIDCIINPDKSADVTSIILAHPNSPKKIELLKKCIESSSGTKIVSSNYQLDDEVQKISDYCLVSNKNEILKQEDFSKFRVDYYLTTNTASGVLRKRFEFEHGYAVYCLIRDGLRFAKSLGFKTVHVINYDYLISEETFKNHLSALKDNDCVFYDYQKEYYDKDSFNTGFFSGKTDALLSFFEHYKTKSEYYSEPTFPINILEIKTFDFFDKSGLKIFKIPNNKIREGGNEVNIVEVSWEDQQINIPP
jgi:autotransporter strand-loop-strand O-heptosyltransferase